jgi:hypothetical protein
VTTPRQSVSVSRTYTPDADACLQAVSSLLKEPVNHEGNPRPATLGNDGRIKGDSADARIIRH